MATKTSQPEADTSDLSLYFTQECQQLRFLEIFIDVSRGVLAGPRPRPAPPLTAAGVTEAGA